MSAFHDPTLVSSKASGATIETPHGSWELGVVVGDPNGVHMGQIGSLVLEAGTTKIWKNVDGAAGWAVLGSSVGVPLPPPQVWLDGGRTVSVDVAETDVMSGQWLLGDCIFPPTVIVDDTLAPFIANGLRIDLMRRRPRGTRLTGKKWTHPSPGLSRKWDGGSSSIYAPRTITEWAVSGTTTSVDVSTFLTQPWFKRGPITWRDAAGGNQTVDAPVPTFSRPVRTLAQRTAWSSQLSSLYVAFRYSAYIPDIGEWVHGPLSRTVRVSTRQSPLRQGVAATVANWPVASAELNPTFNPKEFMCSFGH